MNEMANCIRVLHVLVLQETETNLRLQAVDWVGQVVEVLRQGNGLQTRTIQRHLGSLQVPICPRIEVVGDVTVLSTRNVEVVEVRMVVHNSTLGNHVLHLNDFFICRLSNILLVAVTGWTPGEVRSSLILSKGGVELWDLQVVRTILWLVGPEGAVVAGDLLAYVVRVRFLKVRLSRLRAVHARAIVNTRCVWYAAAVILRGGTTAAAAATCTVAYRSEYRRCYDWYRNSPHHISFQ
mmetsp:Transcript_17972/g.20582  ORF Transcript_17972/g.20582 Transcript_17972/m.20582 type:complete len:237 (+) Transcript_17972:2125-2835(+)